MATPQQEKFGRLPINRPKPPVKIVRKPVDFDPDSGLPWKVLREQQARLKAEYLERQARRRAA